MGWFEDEIVDPVKDAFSDPLGFAEDLFNQSMNLITFGQWNYAKDALRDYVSSLIPEREYTDRTRTVRQPTAARQGIYGRVRTGGQLVYAASNGKDKAAYWACYVLAGHEVEEIEEVWADGELVATSNGPGVNGLMNRDTSTSLGDNQLYWSVHGNRFSAFIPSANVSYGDETLQPPNWTTDHRLSFQAYVWVHFIYDKDTFQDSGLPRLEFTVRGRNQIYDPRDGSTGYTDNHALVMLDILRWDRTFGIPDADIDLQAFADAADISDEQVATGPGTTERRYTANGTFKFQITPLELLNSVAQAGAAFPVYSQGQWSMVPGAYSSPVMDLDESDMIGGLSFQPGPSKRNRHNKASGTYVDESQNFESVGFSQLLIDDYVDEDKEVLEKSFEFAWTNSGTMARRLAKINIERNRFGVSVNAAFKFRTVALSPGDRVTLSVDGLGWDKRVFRVESMEVSFDSGVQLQLREDDPAIYDWTEGDVLAIDDPPALDIPDAVGISAPENVSVTEELYETVTRSAVHVRLTVSWDDQPSARAYDIQFKRSDRTQWIDAGTFWQDDEIEISDVDDVPYDIRVRGISGLGFRSAWTQIQYDVVGKSVPPPDVPTLFVEKRILKWQLPSAPLDLAGYLIRFHNRDRQTWVDATPAHEGVVTETRFEVDEFAGTKTFLVKAIDTTGNVSDNPAVLIAGLGDPLVENVIDEQTEAPTWTGGEQEIYDFSVVSGGVKQPFNVTYQGADERFQVQSSASYIGAFVNSNNHLEALEIGGFYADSTDLFYSQDATTKFYSAEYERVEYTWTYEVLAADEGADLTVTTTINNADNDSVEYIPPGLSSFIAFPGSVEAEVGVYTFKLTIPAQQSTAPPIVEQIFTRLDVDDVEERLGDVAISSGGTRLPIQKSYREIVTVNMTLQDDAGTAEVLRIIDKDETNGPLVKAYDSSGAETGATIDAIVQGF